MAMAIESSASQPIVIQVPVKVQVTRLRLLLITIVLKNADNMDTANYSRDADVDTGN